MLFHLNAYANPAPLNFICCRRGRQAGVPCCLLYFAAALSRASFAFFSSCRAASWCCSSISALSRANAFEHAIGVSVSATCGLSETVCGHSRAVGLGFQWQLPNQHAPFHAIGYPRERRFDNQLSQQHKVFSNNNGCPQLVACVPTLVYNADIDVKHGVLSE